MKKKAIIRLTAGVAVVAAAAISGKLIVDKVVQEISEDVNTQCFRSPCGDNLVTVTFGTSKTARGLTQIKVKASAELRGEDCNLVAFAKRGAEFLNGNWTDNEHFKLLIGSGRRKQCCDVDFEGSEIVVRYYLLKSSV